MAKVTHGHSRRGQRTKTFRAWVSMRTRCENPKVRDYIYYGGRGVIVCERWHTFTNFLIDMGEAPPGKSLDRWPDKDGNYEPGNCRWATPAEQTENRRKRKDSLTREQSLAVQSDPRPARVVAIDYGIGQSTVYYIKHGLHGHN